MSLTLLWYRRAIAKGVVPVEWEALGHTHILAARFPNDWDIWCHLKPGEAWNQHLPKRGWPAEEATIMPFRLSHITCSSCAFMWNLQYKKGAANFLGKKMGVVPR